MGLNKNMIKKYQLELKQTEILEAENKEKAVDKFFDQMIQNNQTATTFLCDILKVKEVFLASQLSEEALEKVLEDEHFAYINTEDEGWAYRDEAPFLEIETLGLEIDTKQLSWNLDYPHRQLFFSYLRDGSGNRQLGIAIVDKDKLVKRLQKDLKISAKVAKAMKDGEIELFFETTHYGGGDGKTSLNYNDNTEKRITDKIPNNLLNLDEALQGWFEENVVNYLLKSFQADYDYLTSKEAVIETLDANEFLFSKEGYRL